MKIIPATILRCVCGGYPVGPGSDEVPDVVADHPAVNRFVVDDFGSTSRPEAELGRPGPTKVRLGVDLKIDVFFSGKLFFYKAPKNKLFPRRYGEQLT